MKKTNKILGGLLAVLLVGVLGVNVVKADTLYGAGSSGKDATVLGIDDTTIYTVNIKWGSLKYVYHKVSEGNYTWIVGGDDENTYRDGNFVEVTNFTNVPIKATLSWESSITGVTASYSHTNRTIANGTCTALSAVIWGKMWSDNGLSGEYRIYDRENALYTDDTCTTLVEDGASYNSSNTYYYVSLNRTTSVDSDNATIPSPELYENASFTPVGSFNAGNGTTLPTITEFGINLAGGSLSDVTTAYNTQAKKIGTVTVTISDAD